MFLLLTLNEFHSVLRFSIFDFEQGNAGWPLKDFLISNLLKKEQIEKFIDFCYIKFNLPAQKYRFSLKIYLVNVEKSALLRIYSILLKKA